MKTTTILLLAFAVILSSASVAVSSGVSFSGSSSKSIAFDVHYEEPIVIKTIQIKRIEEATFIIKGGNRKIAFFSPVVKEENSKVKFSIRAVGVNTFYISESPFEIEEIVSLMKECTLNTYSSLSLSPRSMGTQGARVAKKFCSGNNWMTLTETPVPWGMLYILENQPKF